MNSYPAHRNRLLELEQELLRKRAALAGQTQADTPLTRSTPEPEINPFLTPEPELAPQNQVSVPPQPRRRIVQYQVFDWNEPIQLQCPQRRLEEHPTPQAAYLDWSDQAALTSAFNLPAETYPSVAQQLASAETQPTPSSTYSPPTLEDVLKAIPLSEAAQLMNAIRTLLNTPKPAESASSAAQETTSLSTSASRSDAHDLSSQMGADMTYATAFDLGTVEIEVRSDRNSTASATSPVDVLPQPEPVQPPHRLALELQFDAFDRLLRQGEESLFPLETAMEQREQGEQQQEESRDQPTLVSEFTPTTLPRSSFEHPGIQPISFILPALEQARAEGLVLAPSAVMRSHHPFPDTLSSVNPASYLRLPISAPTCEQSHEFLQKLAALFLRAGQNALFLTLWLTNMFKQTTIHRRSLHRSVSTELVAPQKETLALPLSPANQSFKTIYLPTDFSNK